MRQSALFALGRPLTCLVCRAYPSLLLFGQGRDIAAFQRMVARGCTRPPVRNGVQTLPQFGDPEHSDPPLAIRFRAGSDSVFGGDSLIESDLCPQCVQEVLGPWLKITPDDPREPQHRLDGEPRYAYQEYQLPGTVGEARSERPWRPNWPNAGE